MDIVVRAAVVFFLIYFATRAIGRRELNSFEPFDLILLVVTGDLVQQGVTQSDYSLTGALLAVATITLMTVGLSFLNYRFPRLRPVLDGEPIVLIEDGEPIERNLRRQRLTMAEVNAEARQAQISSIDKVRWAILETDGRISFVERESDD